MGNAASSRRRGGGGGSVTGNNSSGGRGSSRSRSFRRNGGGGGGDTTTMDSTKELDPGSITPIGRDENGQLIYQSEHLRILDRLGSLHLDDSDTGGASSSYTTPQQRAAQQQYQHRVSPNGHLAENTDILRVEHNNNNDDNVDQQHARTATVAPPQRQASRLSTLSARDFYSTRQSGSFPPSGRQEGEGEGGGQDDDDHQEEGPGRNCFMVIAIVILSFILVLLVVVLSVVVLNPPNNDEQNDKSNDNDNAFEIPKSPPPPPPPTPTLEPTRRLLPSWMPTFVPTLSLPFPPPPTRLPATAAAPSSLRPTLAPSLAATVGSPKATPLPLSSLSVAPTRIPLACPVCADGTRELEEPYNSNLLFPYIPGNSFTCGTLARNIEVYVAQAAADAAAADSSSSSTSPQEAAASTCLSWQVTASMRCGCRPYPHPQAYCPLCPDGSLPPPEILDQLTPEVDDDNATVRLTCSDLIWSAAVMPINAGTTCSANITPQWASYCACPGYTNTRNEPTVAPVVRGGGGGGVTATSTVKPTAAPTRQRVLTPLTMKPTTAAPTTPPPTTPPPPTLPSRTICTQVCADGQPISPEYYNAYAVTTVGPLARNLTCLEFETEIETFEDDCFLLELFGTYNCGCVNPHPASTCSLCPGEGLPLYKEKQLNEFGTAGRLLTCQDLWLEGARSTNDLEGCFMFQSRYGSQCGCPPIDFKTLESDAPTVAPSNSGSTTVTFDAFPPSLDYNCSSLCHDGSAPKFPDNAMFPQEDDKNITCGEFVSVTQDAVTRLARDQKVEPELACITTQLVGSARCGCPYPHPNQTCALCGTTSPPVEFLDRMVPPTNFSCFRWMFELARISDPDECDAKRSPLEEACGCLATPDNDDDDDDDDDTTTATIAALTPAPSLPPSSSPPSSSLTPVPSLVPSTLLPTLTPLLPTLTPSLLPTTPQPTTQSPIAAASSSSSSSSLPPTPPTSATTAPPTLPLVCPLCWDESTPLNPSAPFFGPNVPATTCLEVSSFLVDALIVSQMEKPNESRTYSQLCTSLQLVASLRCGCPYPHPQQLCLFCGTTTPKPDLEIEETPTGQGKTTCADIVREVAWTEADSANCTEARELHEASCGC